jgi:POT family proton-dependent oligopeptide transporter
LTTNSLHQVLDKPDLSNKKHDMAGEPLTARPFSADEKAAALDASSHSPSAAEDDGFGGDLPTEEEKKTLRRVGDKVPKAAFLVAVVELCERFTYYGASGLFQNYIQRPLDGRDGPGALGMGHQGATGLSTFFQFWCYGTFARSLHARGPH